jgi:hypothetical protein
VPTQSLLVPSSYGYSTTIEYDEVVHNYGSGYSTSSIVGHSEGVLYYTLRFDFLHYATDQLSLTDPEDLVLKSYPAYLLAFFKRRKIDGEAFNLKYSTDPFNLVDPTTGSSVLVKFIDRRLTLENVTFRLYTSGIQLKQYRAAS